MTRLFLTTSCLAALAPAFTMAQGQTDRIAELEARVAELEETHSSGPDLTFGSGVQTTVEFYGYIQVDFIYDFGAELGATTFPLIGVTDDSQGSSFYATAKETRLGLRTSTDTALGELNTQIEGDFYGGTGAFGTGTEYELRLRRAYVELGPVLAGKTWSTFPPFRAYPVTLDFQGVAGIGFARTEVLRYTHTAGDFVFEGAVETLNAGSSDQPVLVAAAAYDTDPYLLRVAAITGELGDDDDALGTERFHGIAIDGEAALWEGATFQAGYLRGDGIANYLVFLGDSRTADGDTIEAQGAYAGLNQTFGDLTLKGIYGYRHNDEQGPTDDTETLTSVHLLAQYQLVENTTIGLEYYRGTRETFGDEEYDVDRLQASIEYTF